MEDTMQMAEPKKSGSLKVILAVVAALIVLVGGGAAFWYTSGNIDGTWRSAELEKDLIATILKELPDYENEFGLDPSTLFKDPRVQLEVKGGKATMSVQYTVDREAFSSAYDTIIEKGYQQLLDEIGKKAKEFGITKEAALEQVHGKDYEKKIKDQFPSKETFMSQVDESIKEGAQSEGLTYDEKTGVVLAQIANGKVNQLMRVITNAEKKSDKKSDKKVLNDIEYSKYSRSGDTLTLEGKKKYTFKLEKS